tara:strand:- start:221 stop:376 length:156 start_codon:yes stop_codon:yes gene_type:complete
VIKYQFGYRKMRYRRLAKTEAQMFNLMALAKPLPCAKIAQGEDCLNPQNRC